MEINWILVLSVVYVVVLIGALVVTIFATRSISKDMSKWREMTKDAEEVNDAYHMLVAVERVIISTMIGKIGIQDSLEVLEQCGYQISPDDACPTKYTLYDSRGQSVELEFHPDA